MNDNLFAAVMIGLSLLCLILIGELEKEDIIDQGKDLDYIVEKEGNDYWIASDNSLIKVKR